jgi:opacity protein-like surface antigen
MSKLVLVAGIALCFCSPARGQDFSRVEIFGGYSYQNADTNNLASPSRQSANGWDASVSWNYNKWFGLEGDFSGHYNTESVPSTVLIPQLNTPVVDLHVHDFTYLGGPRLTFRPVFLHALFGGDHLDGRLTIPSIPGSVVAGVTPQNSFAAAFGGGIEWKVASHWAVRGTADYLLTRHKMFNLISGVMMPTFTQNNFRASVGIVFQLGSVHAH